MKWDMSQTSHIIFFNIYNSSKNISVTCVTCTILLKSTICKNMWHECDVLCDVCDLLIFRCKGIFFGGERTWNLESHKFQSQVLASVRPVTIILLHWWSCKPVLPVSAKKKGLQQYWNMQDKYYFLEELLKHNSTNCHYTQETSHLHLLWEC